MCTDLRPMDEQIEDLLWRSEEGREEEELEEELFANRIHRGTKE